MLKFFKLILFKALNTVKKIGKKIRYYYDYGMIITTKDYGSFYEYFRTKNIGGLVMLCYFWLLQHFFFILILIFVINEIKS